MEEFLKTVAIHYKDKSIAEARRQGVPASLPLSQCLFCFPNRRSALFFSRHLRQAFGCACCLPAFTTISELFSLFSTRQIADRTTLLFRLFQVYDQLSQRQVRETFDQFVFWGDMLLSDFDDVDKYLVDADRLFSNVRDLKEIEARFSGFTPEQIEVIKSFWRSFRPEGNYPENDKHVVFGQTWAILAQLYHTFRQSLADENLAYEGMMEREVVESLRQHSEGCPDQDLFPALHYRKVVFVGLTAVSEVDRRLLQMLQLQGRAEFCWDYADPRLWPEGSKATSAAYFTRRNLQDFPNELSDDELARGIVPEAERHVSLYSVASAVGQTQQAHQLLLQWQREQGTQFSPLRTAVVLPDEKLLLPMLYAVPQEFAEFNVTMGYSLRNTPVAAFVAMLQKLQQSYRQEGGTFYYREVLPILSHSFTLGICGHQARQLSKQIVDGNLFQVSPDLFAQHPFLQCIFRPVTQAGQALDYLLELLELLMQRAARDINLHAPASADGQGQQVLTFDDPLADEADPQSAPGAEPAYGITDPAAPAIFADTDYEFLYHYRKTVLQLQQQVQRFPHVAFTSRTLFMLLDKLIAGVSVPFSGEPLKGLQVMGVLETRSLDFDNIIILSMNEGVFPAKPVQNTFVPMSLRDAFGMPTQRHRDSVFAYHFYRLIGRASRVAMIYDSRTEGMQSGEESRYVKQLRFLMGHDDLQAQTVSGEIGVVDSTGIVVNKSPEVMSLLDKCLQHTGGQRYLSATALKDYIQCPLKFYLGFVRNLRQDDEVTEGVDSQIFGNILHDAMRQLYSDCEGRQVDASLLDVYLQKPYREVTNAIHTQFYKWMQIDQLEGYNLLIAQILVNYAVETLRHDRSLCPFIYLGSERKQTFVYQAGEGLDVRIKCVYDRLDQPLGQADTVRIVDYKTGNSGRGKKLNFPHVDDLFIPDGKGSKEAFQVMLYCLMLSQATPHDLTELHLAQAPQHLSPHLYFVRDFHPRTQVQTSLQAGTGKASVPIADFAIYHDRMHEQLSLLIRNIFDPQIPFTQCQNSKLCQYCPFINLCKRYS